MWEIIKAGGWMMWPILACSVAVIGIAFERYITLSPRKVAPTELLPQIWQWISNKELTSERLEQIRQSSPLGTVLAAGLDNTRNGRESMQLSMEAASARALHDMERYLTVFSTIGTIGPLMGLLGTVFGIMDAFTAIMHEGAGNATILAGGISKALVTTAAGLCIAIPSVVLFRYYQRLVDSYVVSMEQDATKLVELVFTPRPGSDREQGA